MSLMKKGRIACVVVILAAGSSIFYVKQRGEDHINQAISDLTASGVIVEEQQRNDGFFDFQRNYTARIEDSVLLFNSFPSTANIVVSPLYSELIEGNTFAVEMSYVPWTMAGEVDVMFNSPSPKLVEELATSPAGPLVTKFLQENGLTLYSEITKGKLSQVGLRDIDYVTKEDGVEITIGLHGALATLHGDELVSHLGDISVAGTQNGEQFLWSAQGIEHKMNVSQTQFDFHTLFQMEKSEITVKVQGEEATPGHFSMSFSGVDTDTQVETRQDFLYAKEKGSVENIVLRFEEEGVGSEVQVEGLHFESEISDINKVVAEKFITILQRYKEGDESALEEALVAVLQAGGHFVLNDFSVKKTSTIAKKMEITLETGEAQLTADLNISPNSYDPQLAPPLALAEYVTASLDFQMLVKDYEAIKALSGMGVFIDGFVVKEGTHATVSTKFDGKILTVNGEPVM